MNHEISNENQTPEDASYKFGDFELRPGERLLKRGGDAIPLAPKVFDALVCLVNKADRLVTKDELAEKLWPATFVAEASLTNTIVSLRKVVGHDSIRTVSKYGYRFTLKVYGEPGMPRGTYERLVRAKELTETKSLEALTLAREHFWICVAENPSFVQAWAWMGRVCWLLAKLGEKRGENVELANAAFRRALALDPDSAPAHRFYTPLETDTGSALNALVRLLERAVRYPHDPETFAGLVQVFRFCGLLEESIQAHERTVALDPTVVTSVPHTYFLLGQYPSTIEAYTHVTGYYLDAAAWAAFGNEQVALQMTRKRMTGRSLSGVGKGIMGSFLALLEGRFQDGIHEMEVADMDRELEGIVYFARHYSRMGFGETAVRLLKQVANAGFVCSPSALKSDVWLEAARADPGFAELLALVENKTAAARLVLQRFSSVLRA